ncbi:peptidase domain-containing ABC transporter [Flavobacterium daejeonense]|uniref:peptidase domain-containing ABC transporter n=1 Tax=Flavobacterium daejeonense TaxID=350893 RepID=UPI0005546596|nr:peptidase domain-containing ABC transporter [Flavobacterium daejeonense]
MITFNKFPFIQQLDSSDCGIACIRMISNFYGVTITNKNPAITKSNISQQGLSFAELKDISTKLGYECLFVKLDFNEVKENVTLPAIFFWNQNHFIVVYKLTKNKIFVSDPGMGRIIYNKKDFFNGWKANSEKGILLVLKPTEKLYKKKDTNNETDNEKRKSFINILKYLLDYKKHLYLLAFTLLLSTIIEFIFPFFTQKIVDNGVKFKNISFLHLILIGEFILFVSKILNEFYRSWLFIHISSRISLHLVSDFLIKLMRLPIKFFYSKSIGDLLERIEDHKRVENFLVNDSLKSIFSFFSIIVFSTLLLYYNFNVFLIFITGSILELIWIFHFFDSIKKLDIKKFELVSKEKNKNVELITGMQEIKINNLEAYKRKEWENIQLELFNNNIENLLTNQKFESYRFFSFLTSILITFTSAYSVINGRLSLGSMVAIVFIVGAVNVPVTQLINLILNFQLVMVSILRLNEIHDIQESSNSEKKLDNFEKGSIHLKNISFAYNGDYNVLNNINLKIKKGTTTAIVGISGSGKSTLVKLLLKFYYPEKGVITIDNENLNNLDDKIWRSQCGVVLQDSFIFSNSIAFNVTMEEEYDMKKLINAVEYANIKKFIEKLPMNYNTIIGQQGIGISQGQKQRILIARAIYKNPHYIFLDEATSALDTENEKIIHDNLQQFFKGKTVVIIAHRLSTVKNADQIIVLNNGKISEKGTHHQLINNKRDYYNLIKNQLELEH